MGEICDMIPIMFTRKNKSLTLPSNVSSSQFEDWLIRHYDFRMSDAGLKMFFHSLKNDAPFHLMQWSDFGDVFLRVHRDESNRVSVEYQFAFDSPEGEWKPVTTLADEAKLVEGQSEFHLFNGMRQELRKSLDVPRVNNFSR